MAGPRRVPIGIKFVIGFFLLSFTLWTIGQGGAVVCYDTVAGMGLQEPRETVDPVIVEVNRGIGFGDVVIQIPLFLVAAIGLWKLRFFGGSDISFIVAVEKAHCKALIAFHTLFPSYISPALPSCRFPPSFWLRLDV